MTTLSDTRIADIRVTPVAFSDPPLLNNAGCHQPFALRSIIELETEAAVIGLGESYGNQPFLDALARAIPEIIGLEITNINGLWRCCRAALKADSDTTDIDEGILSRVVSAIEVSMWDAWGKTTGRKLCDLLGGQVRSKVSFSAYLFYKFARHAGNLTDDNWGEALTPEGMVEQARRMRDLHGFDALKLKAGIMPPELEVATLHALRAAFPDAPLRIDPNGGWKVSTCRELLPELENLVQYLEDPVVGIQGNAEIQASTSIPLATNMYVVSWNHLAQNARSDAFRVILSDHHYWGGLQACRELARICHDWGWGLSMHSNSHLGISLAAMAHLAAATPNLGYECDTHYPWQTDDVITGGKLTFDGGALTIPDGPGLGVTLDHDALAKLHSQYLKCGIRVRDDASEMKKHWPDWCYERPKF